MHSLNNCIPRLNIRWHWDCHAKIGPPKIDPAGPLTNFGRKFCQNWSPTWRSSWSWGGQYILFGRTGFPRKMCPLEHIFWSTDFPPTPEQFFLKIGSRVGSGPKLDFHRNKISATDPLNVTPCGCVYHFERSTSRKCEMSRVKLILATLLFCWSIRVAENADSPKCSSKPKKADLSKTSPS